MTLPFRPKAIATLVVAFALIFFCASFVFGQGIATGSISGTVTDQSGAVITAAKVTAQNVATGQLLTTLTNETGFFTFRAILPGTYKVTIEAKGFTSLVVNNVDVSVSKDTSLAALKVDVAKAGETVEVNASAAPLIETTTSQVSALFDPKVVQDLPLSGGPDALALYVPGIADSGSNNFSNTNGAGFSANGLRGRSNYFEIDGQSNNDNSVAGPSIFLGNQDAIAELNIISDNFSVEYGHASGTVINYVTKSGTNEFHGSAFEYNTNSWLDSHTNEELSPLLGVCLPGQDPNTTGCTPRKKPSAYTDNRFGGGIGGPIWRNKAWFFGSYMGQRTRAAGSPSTSAGLLTPTPNGLSQLAAAFPGNSAVAALQAIGPFSVKTGNPIPTGGVTTIPVSDGNTTAAIEFAQMQRSIPSLYNDYETVDRVDIQATSKDRLGVRYVFQQNIQTAAAGRFAAGAWVDVPARDQQIALDWSRTISNSFVNSARFSYSRAGFGFEGGSFPNCTRANILSCPTGIQFQSTYLNFGIQNNLPQGRLINNTQVQDNASWVRGHHTFKFGGEYYRQRSPNTFLPNINGTYIFSNFDSFLQDSPAALNLTDGPTHFNFKQQDLSFYAGDDWRVRDDLTLNLGLRWDYSTNAVNLLHDISILNQRGANPFWDPAAPAHVTTIPEVPNQYRYFGPNVGFAWKPRFFGTADKLVLRGGYRITYDPQYYNMFLNVATSAPVVNAGTITACTLPCLPTAGFTGTDVRAGHLSDIPRGVNPGLRNQTRVSPDFKDPYTQSWSFGLQYEITSHMVLESRYAGNHVVGNFQTVNANPALAGLVNNGFSSFIPSGVAPCATAGTPGFPTRADCNFRNERIRENSAWSRYNGWQNQLRIQNWHGVNAGVSYTWSKTLDNASEIFSTFSGGNTIAGAQNPFDTNRAEKSLSGLDFPHVASLYLVYDIPLYKNQQGLLGHVLGGYQVNATWRYSSGQLWTPAEFAGDNSSCQTSFDFAFFSGGSTCRPFVGNLAAPISQVGVCTDPTLPDCGITDLNTLNPTTISAVHWILNDDNAAAFFGTPYGNARRNPGVRGDAPNTMNMSVFKTTKISERVTMRLEVQAVNLLNHMFRGVPDPFMEDGNYPNGFNNGAPGSFANTFFNSSGGDYTNPTALGLARRRFSFGAKITF